MSVPARATLFRFGAFELDVRAGELRKNGASLRLHGQPLEVLQLLVERAGDVVLREDLRQQLWPADTFVDFDHSLNNAIARIRDALGDSAEAPRFVATVPRRGYRFLGSVESVSPPSIPDSTRFPTTSRASFTARRFFVAVALLLTVGGGLIAWRLTSAPAPHRIAVLPLDNLSAQPDSDYFSDGLTDEIIGRLSLIEGLEVKSRTSSFAFKKRPRNIREIGRQLGVDLVLEGSVVRDGQRLRINADLVRVQDDAAVWSASYERDVSDVLAVQDEISRSIVNQLRLKNIGGQRRYETDVDAYELYMRAEALADEEAPGNDPRLQQAVSLFQEAVAREPDFAPAYAGMADAYASLRQRGRSLDAGRKLREAAAKAIGLDPLLPEANATIGLARAADLAWSDAEQAFERALQLNPNLSLARREFAIFVLLPEGKVADALQQMRRAVELDPLSASAHTGLAFVLMTAGRYGDALEISNQVLAAHPDDVFASQLRARALLLNKTPQDALAILQRQGPPSYGYLGWGYATLGRRADAERLAADDEDPAAARHRVLIYAALGERERAFEALQKLADTDDYMADIAPGQPELAAMRDDPRMLEFRRRRNLH